jgi:hypothetical protein
MGGQFQRSVHWEQTRKMRDRALCKYTIMLQKLPLKRGQEGILYIYI